MSRLIKSHAKQAADRGHEFGELRAEQIARNCAAYLRLYQSSCDLSESELARWGAEALDATASWAPSLADEIEGVAHGAGVGIEQVAALNARTEVLGRLATGRGECSLVASLGLGRPPIAMQTWDWYEDFSSGWLVWEFEDGNSGLSVQTLTEAGVLGKVGVNSAGVGILLNVLHHDLDGSSPMGVPIHVVLRRILIEAQTVFDAVRLIGSARVSASSAITVVAEQDGDSTAMTAEVYPGDRPSYVLPNERGILVHTNHFLAEAPRSGDRESVVGPDSLFRYDLLRRRTTAWQEPSADDFTRALTSHMGGGGALCCHPEPDSLPLERYATLATVLIDPADRSLRFAEGGPCGTEVASWTTVRTPTTTVNNKENSSVRSH